LAALESTFGDEASHLENVFILDAHVERFYPFFVGFEDKAVVKVDLA
jgi:hypothetical protein